MYKREAYELIEYFGDLGGLFEIVQLLAYFLTAGIIKRLYHAAIISNTYSIQHYDRDNYHYYHSNHDSEDRLTSESSCN